MVKIKRVKYPNVLNKEQLVKLFEAIDKPKVMIACFTAFFCGLRIDEVCHLKVNDIDLVQRRLKVINSKFNKDRYVPILPQTIGVIRLWMDIIGDHEWFLPSAQNPASHLDKKTLYQHYYRILETVNLRIIDFRDKMGRPRYRYYFHTLRHTYATYLLEKGVPIEHISRSLGHAQLETTQIYAHISDVELQRRIDEAFNNPNPMNYQRISSNFLAPKKEEIKPKFETNDPMAILKIRLAEGNIDVDEFNKRMAVLNSNQSYIG